MPGRPIAIASLLLLIVAACSNGSSQSASAVASGNPDYVPVGEQADNGNTINISVANPGTLGADNMTLSLHFGLAVAAHKDDGPERAEHLTPQGSGSRPEEAYIFDDLKRQQDAIEVACSFIARLYPARHGMHAVLLKGPGKTYVAQLDFVDGAMSRRLYFDLTGWAEAIKAGA